MNDKWHRHFLDRALTVSKMSKDPSTHVGAILVNPQGRQISDGYNGFPRGIADTVDRLYNRETKLKLTIHAERNALLNAAAIGVSTVGATLYIVAQDAVSGLTWGGPPCTHCSIEVIQAGIVRVVSFSFKNVPSRWAEDLLFARDILHEAKLNYTELDL